MANRYWVGGSGTWDNTSTANWSSSSGGATGASAPTSSDAVFFDANSGASAVVDVTATAACSTSSIDKSDINLSLSGNATFSNTMTLTSGTLTLNSYTLTTTVFFSNNTNARTIDFGTGNIVVTLSNATVWGTQDATNLVCLGAKKVTANYSGSVGTRNILHGTTAGSTEANTPNFYVTAGSDIILVGSAGDLNFTGFSGTLSAVGRSIYGSLIISPTMTLSAGAGTTTFRATSGVKTITFAGKTLDFPVSFNGVGGTWAFQDAAVFGSARIINLTNGALDANDQTVNLGLFALGAGTKTLTLGNKTWTVLGGGTAWNANTNVTGLTVSASTGAISMSSASAKTFAGGGKTWPTINQGGAGALTIQQSNTFVNITNTVQPATITLTSGTTQTVTDFDASGTAGNLITLNASTPGAQATLSDSSGTNSVSYVSITDIAAAGAASWNAYTVDGNVDGGNNTGWVFDAPTGTANDNVYELRSFTEKRRF